MKLGVVSDTHKHIVNLSKALELLKKQGVDKIIHLGDDYTDIDELAERNIVRVPGVFGEAYQDEKIQNRKVENYVGWRFLLTHTISSHPNDQPGDPKPEELIKDERIQVVLYGHTHVPEIRQDRRVIFINPGHLKNEDKKGFPPTFGYIELSIDRILVRIHELREGSILKEERFRKP